MTADQFSPDVHDPEDRSRLRALMVSALLILATVFIYQAMDGMYRASEQAERREHLARAACREMPYEEYVDDSADRPNEAPADTGAENPAPAPASTGPAQLDAPADADHGGGNARAFPAEPSVP